MHIYICPFCDPSRETHLVIAKLKRKSCEHKKDKECKAEDYKCKEVMKCNKCKQTFAISKKFLEGQKRKIKDG
tara:strand:- start:309 stop:527 length:219 start_codon:yes stop_codon:yes gene_type:complete